MCDDSDEDTLTYENIQFGTESVPIDAKIVLSKNTKTTINADSAVAYSGSITSAITHFGGLTISSEGTDDSD